MKPTLGQRFWSKVNVTSFNGCWLWTGKPGRGGYGRFLWLRKTYPAHRVAYASVNDWPDESKDVCHKCDVRLCVNPAHLFAGTRGDNIRDCVQKRRHRSNWPKREAARTAKLTWAQVDDIRTARLSRREYAEKYGVHVGNVRNIQIGKIWKQQQAIAGEKP